MSKLSFEVSGTKVETHIPDHLANDGDAIARMCQEAILNFKHKREVQEMEDAFLLSVRVS